MLWEWWITRVVFPLADRYTCATSVAKQWVMWLLDRRNVSFQSPPRTSEVLNSPRNSDYFGLEEFIIWSSLVYCPSPLSACWVQSLQHQLGRASSTAPCHQPGGMLSKAQCSSQQGNLHFWYGNLSWKSAPFTWPTLSSWTENFSASLVKDLFFLWKRNHEMRAVRFSKSHSRASARMKEQTLLSGSCIIFSVSLHCSWEE